MGSLPKPKRFQSPSPPSQKGNIKYEELSLALLNINGLKLKTKEIQYIFTHHKVHAMALCETKLNEEVKINEYSIPWLQIKNKDRSDGNGGGVAVYYQDHINAKKRMDMRNSDIEIIWVEMKFPEGRPVLLGCCYRPPDSKSEYLDEIRKMMTQVSKEKEDKDIFLMGDFNIDWDPNSGNKKMDLMSELGFTQIVKDATRVAIDSETCIDHIYTNIPERCSKPESIATGSSDHNLVIVKVEMRWSKENNKLMTEWRKDCKKVYDSLRLDEGLETLIYERDKAKQAEIEKIHTFMVGKKKVLTMAGSRNPKSSQSPSLPPEEELSLALLNINGLKKKTKEIQYIFKDHKVHAMALCDTRLKQDDIVIQGLKIDKDARSNKSGRGVAVCYHNHIQTELRSDLNNPKIEIIWVEMKLPGRPVLLGCCYRRPKSNKLYLDEIEKTITQASREKEDKDIFLMGDFNIDWDPNSGNKKMDLMSELRFTQIVKDATRVAIDSETCIDHIYTNIPKRCSKPESIATGSSDHNLVIVKVKMRWSKENNELKAKWRKDCEKVYDSLRLDKGLETLISERDKAKKAAIKKIHTFMVEKKAVTDHENRKNPNTT